MRNFLIPLLALSLGACTTTGNLDGIPAERLVCPDEPGRPAGDPETGAVSDEENGEYLRRLRGAYLGCKEDIDWLRDYATGRN